MAKRGVDFKPTAAQKRRVEVAAGGGMTHEEIALSLGITRPTLYKHFDHELSVGALARRAEVIEKLFEEAKAGSVPACKAYLGMTPTPAVAVPPEQAERQSEKAPAPLGKKEQAQADAVTAARGTEWGDDLAPRGRLQ